MSKRLSVEDVKNLYGKEYIFTTPAWVPDGKVLVHNHVTGLVKPNTPPGTNGFRAWFQPAPASDLIVCECGWAPAGVHYRLDLPHRN